MIRSSTRSLCDTLIYQEWPKSLINLLVYTTYGPCTEAVGAPALRRPSGVPDAK